MPEPITTKTCRDCGETLPLDAFRAHKSTRDRRDSYCKPCANARGREWRAKNAAKLKAYKKRYYLENRETLIAKAQMHKGIKNSLTRRRFPLAAAGWKFCLDCAYMLPLEEFYVDQGSADGRMYRCKDCSRSLRYNLMTRAAMARRRADDGLPFTACDMLRIYKQQRGRCYHCGIPLRKKFDLDHLVPISSGGGNEPGNVVCSCPSCNSLKANLDLEEFRARHITST